MFKRITAMLLSIAMVVGMIVVPTKAEDITYTDAKISSIYYKGAWFEPQIDEGNDPDNWRIYLKAESSLPGDSWTSYNFSATNGKDNFNLIAYKDSDDGTEKIMMKIPKDYIDEWKTTTFTIKAGKYQTLKDGAGLNTGINLTEDFNLYINAGSWSTDVTKVTPAVGSNVKLTLNINPGNDQVNGKGGDANGFYLFGDIEDELATSWEIDLTPLTSVVDGSENHHGGLFEGTSLGTNLFIRKFDSKNYYVGINGGAKTNAEYTVKGVFKDSNGILTAFKTFTVIWDGTKWTEKKSASEDDDTQVGTYSGKLTLEGMHNFFVENNNKDSNIYLLGTDGYLPDAGEDWESPSRIFTAADDNSGVYVEDKKVAGADIKKFTGGSAAIPNMWYIGNIKAREGSVLTVKGTFESSDKKAKVTIEESKFTWNGTAWVTYVEPVPPAEVVTYTGKLELENVGWYIDHNAKDHIYLHATDTYLAGEGEEWNDNARRFTPEDDNSGVFVEGRRIAAAEIVKFRGSKSQEDGITNMYYIGNILAREGSILTIKGNLLSNDEKVRISLTESKFVWTGSEWQEYTGPIVENETNRTLSIDTATNNGGNQNGIYMLTNDGFALDTKWENPVKASSQAGSGVYLNGEKIDVKLFKYEKGKMYLALVDSEITAKDKDEIVIKGIFQLGKYYVGYKEVKFYYNGQVWSTKYTPPVEVKYTDITLDKMLDVTKYQTDGGRWDIYISTKGKLPGVGDKITFENIKVEIDGKEHLMGSYHASHEDSFFFMIDKTIIPGDVAKNTKIVIKAGKYKSSDVSKGINIKKDFTIYVNKYGISDKKFLQPAKPEKTNIKLTIDRQLLYGGDGNGIFLLSEDKFPVDKTWQSSIRAITYDKNSGVFVNGKKVDAVLKKFEDGKIYIGLVDGGVVAKDGDKVEIKGTFIIGEKAMSFAHYTFYYNGKTWNTKYFKQKTEKVKLSGVSINEVSARDDVNQRWNVYVNLKGKIPGQIDVTSFTGIKIYVNGKQIEGETVYHSYMDTMYFPISYKDLPKDAKNGTKITIKKSTGSSSDRLSEIIWEKEFNFYVFAGSFTAEKPTTNTNWLNVSDISLFKTCPYHEDWQAWQVLIAVKETFKTEGGTFYFQLPIYINGKEYEVRATQSGTNIAFDVRKEWIDPDANGATLTIKKGATALANAGKDGLKINDDLTIYLYNRSWTDKKYTSITTVDCEFAGVQDTTFVKNPDGTGYSNVYIWSDTKMPGEAWFEAYLVPITYNGEAMTVQMERVVSTFGRLMYVGIYGIPKEGDTVTFKGGTKTYAGGVGFRIKKDYTIKFSNGQWTEYVKSDVTKPKAVKSLWDVARFDTEYIPFTTNGVVTFTNTDKHNVIKSVEPMKDYTIKFKARKLEDNDASLPNFSMVLRGNQLDENTELTQNALSGYVVTFQYGQMSLFKGSANWELTDAYRIAYEPLEENEKFFEYGEEYEYEVSVYNVTDDCVCITISVNGVEQIRYYDHASGEKNDPVTQAGDFRIYAECATSIEASPVKSDEMIISSDTTETEKGVYVAASYPYVDDDTQITVDKAGAFVEDGMFKATEPGTYVVSGTYKGKPVESKTIVVTQAEKKKDTTEEEIYEEVVVVNWGAIIAVAAVAVVVVLGGIVVLIIVLKKRKKARTEVK